MRSHAVHAEADAPTERTVERNRRDLPLAGADLGHVRDRNQVRQKIRRLQPEAPEIGKSKMSAQFNESFALESHIK